MNKLISATAIAALATTVFAEDTKVLKLTADNFDATLTEKGQFLAKFYAPWCGHCKTLAPEYEKAAELLGDKGTLVSVDCTEHRDLCSTHGIRGFPTLKLFNKDGSVVEYDDARKADAIAKWVSKQSQPAYVVLATEAEYDAFKTQTSSDLKLVVNGGADSEAVAEVKKAAGTLRKDVEVAIYTGGKADNTITLLRTFDEPEVVYTGDVKAADIITFVKGESLPLVGEIGPQNFMKYVDRNVPLVWAFVDYNNAEQVKSVVDALTPAAKQFRDKVVVAKLDGNRWGEHAKSFGLSGATPGLVIEDRSTRKNYVFPETSAITAGSIEEHIAKFVKGELSPNIKSEEIPAENNGPVKTLVAKQYEDLVVNSKENVIVSFVASWCGHCKSLHPKWDELGKLFENEPNVVVARGDATSNDFPVDIQGFPTIYFYPADDKKNPVQYNGERTVEALAKYIRDNSKGLSEKPAVTGHDEL